MKEDVVKVAFLITIIIYIISMIIIINLSWHSLKYDNVTTIPFMNMTMYNYKKAQRRQKFSSVSTPILVVGMPKCGTTSLYEYFKCNNNKYKKVSHWRCSKNHLL